MAKRLSRMRGEKALDDVLRRLPDKIGEKVVVEALKAGAKPILADMKAKVPVRSGELRDAIVMRKATRKQRRFGSAPVIIGFKKPTSRRAHLTEFGTATQRAQPFMRPALDTQAGAFFAAMRDKLGKALEREAKKLAGNFSKSGLGRRRRRHR